MEHSHRFFSNTACRFFPCHPGADPDAFNCLFCYCPLYLLGERCGGDFDIMENGVKDCTRCLRPHRPEGYDEIVGTLKQEVFAKKD